MTQVDKSKLTLPTCPESIRKLENFIVETASKYDICDEKYPNILISLTEAVNNAMIHGNRNDQQKVVNIVVKRIGRCLQFRVKDEGIGFNMNTVPDPTSQQHLECCGGRGVFLIKQLSDRVTFLENGSMVEMQFFL